MFYWHKFWIKRSQPFKYLHIETSSSPFPPLPFSPPPPSLQKKTSSKSFLSGLFLNWCFTILRRAFSPSDSSRQKCGKLHVVCDLLCTCQPNSVCVVYILIFSSLIRNFSVFSQGAWCRKTCVILLTLVSA